jgi:hypothetical protein
MTRAMRKAASEAITKRAKARAADLTPTIAELQAAGAMSLRDIAAGLNERGIPTARGTGTWSATQVMRGREANLVLALMIVAERIVPNLLQIS